MKKLLAVLSGSLLVAMLTASGQSVSDSAVALAQQAGDEGFSLQDQKAKKDAPSDYVQFDQPPEVVKQVQPDYPDEALKKNQEGDVWLKIWVDEFGSVVEAKVMKSSAEVFNNAAIEAGKQWTFKPAIAKGKPVAVWISVPFRFKLGGKAEVPSTGVPVKPTKKVIKGEMTKEVAPPQDNTPYEKPPEAVRTVNPKYPEKAKKAKLEGMVWLKLWVDESGKPMKVVVTKSDAEVFDQPAIEAAKQWLFKPAVLNGKPTAVWVTIPFKFKLGEGKKGK